jgi:hypothetical protein
MRISHSMKSKRPSKLTSPAPPLPPATEAIAKAKAIIAERILEGRPILLDYLHERATSEETSSREWGAESLMGAYRAGSSNAYLDIARRLENDQFSPPNEKADA